MMTNDRSRVRLPGKLMGVCQQAAADMGISPTPVRVVAMIAMLFAFKLTVAAYCVAALIYRLERR